LKRVLVAALIITAGVGGQMAPAASLQRPTTLVLGASRIVVPSYQNQRGHPWLVARSLWDELLTLKAPKTSRDFLKKNARAIHYVNMNTPSVIEDLDTPQDYLKFTS